MTFKSSFRDYLTLTKPEVNVLILIVTSAGYYLGSSRGFSFLGYFNVLIGTLLVASGTATLNQYMEREHDGKMRRTANRPLVVGTLSESKVLRFGCLLSLTGGAYLFAFVNALAALLTLSTLATYLLVYTPLKRKTPICTALGAVPGAMPALIGWVAASPKLGWQAWFLFLVLLLWQFPHFLAIALLYREDYARAGFRMLPAFDAEGKFTRAEILVLTLLLVVVTIVPAASFQHSWLYATVLAFCGAFFLHSAIRLVQSETRQSAVAVIHASVIYLPIALAGMSVFKP